MAKPVCTPAFASVKSRRTVNLKALSCMHCVRVLRAESRLSACMGIRLLASRPAHFTFRFGSKTPRPFDSKHQQRGTDGIGACLHARDSKSRGLMSECDVQPRSPPVQKTSFNDNYAMRGSLAGAAVFCGLVPVIRPKVPVALVHTPPAADPPHVVPGSPRLAWFIRLKYSARN